MSGSVRSVHRFACRLLYVGRPFSVIHDPLPSAPHQSRLSSFRAKMASVQTAVVEPFTPTTVISSTSLPSIKSTATTSSTTRVITCTTSSSLPINTTTTTTIVCQSDARNQTNARKVLQSLAKEDKPSQPSEPKNYPPTLTTTSSNSQIDNQSSFASNNESSSTDSPNLKSIYRNNLYNRSRAQSESEMRPPPFRPRKALVLTKFSRLEYERRRMPDCSEAQIKESVRMICLQIVSNRFIQKINKFFNFFAVDSPRIRL